MSRGHATRSWLVVILCYVCSTWLVCIQFVLTVLFHHLEWDVSTNSLSLLQLGQWAKSHGSCSVEFEEEGDKVRVFLRTWDVDTFGRVCVATRITTAAILNRKSQLWVGWWMHWGLTFRWHQSAVVRPSLLKTFVNIGAVGIVRNSLTTQFLTLGC